jgi:hypothetical protein
MSKDQSKQSAGNYRADGVAGVNLRSAASFSVATSATDGLERGQQPASTSPAAPRWSFAAELDMLAETQEQVV